MILAIGVLEDQLKLRHPELKIAATNVGSLGGLLALQRGETHIAGTHLLDPETGVYNIPDIKRTIPKVPVVLVHLAQREQGILVASGNPQSIRSLEDLTRTGVRFVNRQPGSGTRVLLDYELKKLGIDPSYRRLRARRVYSYGGRRRDRERPGRCRPRRARGSRRRWDSISFRWPTNNMTCSCRAPFYESARGSALRVNYPYRRFQQARQRAWRL